MKTKITALVLATGFLVTAALAENTPAVPAPAPATAKALPSEFDRISFFMSKPAGIEPTDFGSAGSFSVHSALRTENVLTLAHYVGAGMTVPVSGGDLRDASVIPISTPTARVVYSAPPSPAFDYDTRYKAIWEPSITFRFDFGRSHRS